VVGDGCAGTVVGAGGGVVGCATGAVVGAGAAVGVALGPQAAAKSAIPNRLTNNSFLKLIRFLLLVKKWCIEREVKRQ
jgi:hypothetical protein